MDIKLDGEALLVLDPTPDKSTTDIDTHPISHGQHNFGCPSDTRRSFIAHSKSTCFDTPLYMIIYFQSILDI